MSADYHQRTLTVHPDEHAVIIAERILEAKARLPNHLEGIADILEDAASELESLAAYLKKVRLGQVS